MTQDTEIKRLVDEGFALARELHLQGMHSLGQAVQESVADDWMRACGRDPDAMRAKLAARREVRS